MRLGSPLGEAQTETETAVGARLALTDSVEPVENMGLVFGRDARPVVVDEDVDEALLARRLELDRLGVALGVGDQIAEAALDRHRPDPDVEVALGVDLDSCATALGVGAGNTPAVIDELADVRMAVSSILMSKTFDNGMICASEQSVIVVRALYEAVRQEFIARGAVILTPEQRDKLGAILLKKGGINADIVGQPAAKIAALRRRGRPAAETMREHLDQIADRLRHAPGPVRRG